MKVKLRLNDEAMRYMPGVQEWIKETETKLGEELQDLLANGVLEYVSDLLDPDTEVGGFQLTAWRPPSLDQTGSMGSIFNVDKWDNPNSLSFPILDGVETEPDLLPNELAQTQALDFHNKIDELISWPIPEAVEDQKAYCRAHITMEPRPDGSEVYCHDGIPYLELPPMSERFSHEIIRDDKTHSTRIKTTLNYKML